MAARWTIASAPSKASFADVRVADVASHDANAEPLELCGHLLLVRMEEDVEHAHVVPGVE